MGVEWRSFLESKMLLLLLVILPFISAESTWSDVWIEKNADCVGCELETGELSIPEYPQTNDRTIVADLRYTLEGEDKLTVKCQTMSVQDCNKGLINEASEISESQYSLKVSGQLDYGDPDQNPMDGIEYLLMLRVTSQ